MEKLTEQEIEKLAEDKYSPIYGQNKLAQKDAFINGFQTCQDMQKNNYVIRTDNSKVIMNLQKTIAELNLKIEESEWISLPPKELLKSGWYWFKLRHPVTEIENTIVVDLTKSNGLHGYAYATHCKYIPLPQPPTI